MKRYLLIFSLVAVALILVVLNLPTDVHANTGSMDLMGKKGQTRTYYIATDEVKWDYAPSGINQITGEAFDEEANVFVQNGPDRIGKVYLKSQYREYTSADFTTLKPI